LLDDDLRRALSSGLDIRVDAATPIVAEYRRAGGPPYDIGMIVPFIRDRLRWDVARSRAAAAVGEHHDLGYEASEVCAFAALHGTTLTDHQM
jgi:hypothetical protein